MRGVIGFFTFLFVVYGIMLVGIAFFIVGAVILGGLLLVAAVSYLVALVIRVNEADRRRRGGRRRVGEPSEPEYPSASTAIHTSHRASHRDPRRG